MIYKVQVPLASNDPNAPALVYDQGKKWTAFLDVPDLPARVVNAMKYTGKAYFHAEIVDEHIEFGEEAPWQKW